MNTKIILVFTAFFFLLRVYPQSANQTPPAKIQSTVNPNMLILSFDYASNTNVLGNFNTATKQPSFSPSLVFYSKWGADASATGRFIDNSDDSLESFTTELDLSLGYTIKPHKNLTIYPSYAHFFFGDNASELTSIFNDDVRLDVDYNYRFLDLGVSAGYFIGRQNTFYASLHNYYSITFDRFLFRNGSLSIQPGIDANFGDYEYLNLYYLDNLINDPLYIKYLTSYPYIARYIYFEKQRHPGLTTKEILYDYFAEKVRDSFKLTAFTINLPVYFMIGNFGINLGLFAFVPMNQPDYMAEDVQYFFDLGVTYNLTFE